ncbi:DUF1512 domain-containing protein [Stetteria hydrogenophila]
MPATLLQTGGDASLPDWISAISQLVFLIIFILLFLGANQRFQVYMWKGGIKAKLAVLEAMALEAREKTRKFMLENRARNVDETLSKVIDFFVISPVDIEPVDIIKRMDHLFSVRRLRLKNLFRDAMPEADEYVRSRAETAGEIAGALNFIYKYVRHLLLYGEKTRNWVLIMQLQLVMPQILRVAKTYRNAMEDFLKGVPVGDGAGPLVASMLAGPQAEWREVEEETVASEVDFEGRRLVLVKAKGPASSVGRPGLAVEKLVTDYVRRGVKPSLIVTVDAALKLEGEETGSIAEGVGAAIGDPGPEKIRFERVAAEHGIPLRAVVVKMSEEEAITAMKKEIYEAARRAVERVKEIVRSEARPGDLVIVAGIGNTVGVA